MLLIISSVGRVTVSLLRSILFMIDHDSAGEFRIFICA
jgi:hypothetical protein